MACEVKINSIDYLKKNGAINDVRKIIDLDLFDKANDQLTSLAQSKYNLDTYGEKLFTINKFEYVNPSKSTYRRDAKSTTYRAIPNESLFEELQEKFNTYQTKGFNLVIDSDVYSEDKSRYISEVEKVSNLIENKLKIKVRAYTSKKLPSQVKKSEYLDEVFEELIKLIGLPHTIKNIEDLNKAVDNNQPYPYIRSFLTNKIKETKKSLEDASRNSDKAYGIKNLLDSFLKNYNNRSLDEYTSEQLEVAERAFPALFKLEETGFKSIKQALGYYKANFNVRSNKASNIEMARQMFHGANASLDKYETLLNYQTIAPEDFSNRIVNLVNNELARREAFFDSDTVQKNIIALKEKEEARKYKESVKGVLEEIATEEGPGEVWKSLANVFLSHKKTIDAINPNSSVQRAVWSMGGGFWNNGTINVSHKGPGSKEHILLHELAHHFSVPYLRKYFLDGHYNKDLYTNHPERLAPESLMKPELDETYIVEKLTSEEIKNIRKLEKTYQKVLDLHAEGKISFDNGKLGGNAEYGISNLFEFVSEALGNPMFAKTLSEIPGIYNKKSSLLKDVIDAIFKLFGIKNSSLLDDVYYFIEQSFLNKDENYTFTPRVKEPGVDTDIDKAAWEYRNTPLVDINVNDLNNQRSQQLAEALSQRLALGLKVNYENVTKEKAADLLKNRAVKYNGEAGFYYAGTVYLVGDNISPRTVVHEFGHPLLQGLRMKNNILFQKLYKQAIGTEEGQGVKSYVESQYPELDQNSDLFREEVINYALQLSAINKMNDQINTEGFEKFIQNVMAAIKKMLRGIFGSQVKISKMSVDTSIEELAELLLEGKIEIDIPSNLKEEDIVMFGRDVLERAKELEKFSDKDSMQGIVDQIYETNKKILTEAENFKGDTASKKMLKETLFQKGTTRYLREVNSTLKDYLNTDTEGFDENEKIQNALDAAKESLEADLQRSTALVNTLDTTNSMLKNMLSNISQINKSDINNRSTVALLMLYKQNSTAWLKMVEEINELLDMDGKMMDTNNPFYINLNEIVQNITRVNTNIANLLKRNNVQFYVEITGYMSEYVEGRLKENLGIALKKTFGPAELEKEVNDLYYKVTTQELKEEDIDALIKKGVPEKILKGFLQEYEDLVINKDKITEALTGGAKDVTWFNRWLESYSSSNDVVVGPLAMFIENEKSQVENIVWEQSMKFRKKLEKLLPAVGFSKLNSSAMREKMGFLDTVFWVDKETDKPIEKKIWSYHGAFKDYRYHYDLLDYNLEEAKKTEDIPTIATAQLEFDTFKREYMWQDFVPEFYEKDDIFKQSEVGKLAYYVRKQKLAAYNNLVNSMENELERFEEYSTIQAAFREYQQLSSLVYEDGTPKTDDESKGIYDLSIAKVLQEHREATKEFYEFRAIEGLLQEAYNEFVDLLATKNILSDTKEYEREMKKWERQNLRMDIDPVYWEKRNEVLTELREIQERIKETGREQFDVADAYKTIGDFVFSYKDQAGEPNSSDMGNSRLKQIKDLEQEISDYRFNMDTRTGLTKEDSEEFNSLSQKAANGQLESESPEAKRYFYLLAKVEESGISGNDVARMNLLISELGSMSEKLPTIYYMEALNYNLSRLEIKEISEDEVEEVINDTDFQKLLEEDEKLASWFELNHYTIQKWNKERKNYETFYKRTSANNVTTPKDESYINFTEIIDKNTGEPILLKGAPGIRHSRREVKDEYRTIPFGAIKADYVGKYIDNKNQPLPRLYKPGEKYSAKDGRFMNDKYFQLQSSNNAEYQLLEAIKEYHLQNQEGTSNYSKLYLDMPRYSTKRGDIWQAMQKGTYGSRFSELGKNTKEWIKQSFSRSANDAELDFNYDAKNNLVNTDLNGNQISYIPVSGIYNLEHEITDADIFRNIFKYSLSVQTQSKLLESLPLVNSVLETLEDPANEPKELEKFDKNIWNLKGNLQKAKKKFSTNNRLGQVKSLIEREYYGRMVEGIEETHPVFGKWMQSLQGLSAMGSLAFNIPSDLKNKYGAYVQVLIEGLGGEFITLKDFALSRPWAERSMLEWSTKGIYQTGPGSTSTQLIQMFDPQFKSKDEFGREVERSLVKDLANLEWMYMHRKFGEMQVGVALFGAFMFGQKIEQVLTDGTKKSLRYIEAWQKDEDGIIRLKPGVHPGWSNVPVFHEYQRGETLEEIAKKYYIPVEELKAKNRIKTAVQLEDGQEITIAKSEKFLGLKNRIQGTSRKLFGTYDKMGQAEGNKLLLYRMFFFMRKWFTPMFMNRFGYDSKTITWTRGGERYDWATGAYGKGFYLTAFQAMIKTVKSGTRDAAYLSTEEKVSFRKMAGEGLFVIGLSLLAMMVFGFDPEDDEKWSKLKKKSGALNQDTFSTFGFLSNHMLLLMLGVQAESSAFVPLPSIKGLNLGMDDYTKMITQTTSAWYNTVVLYADIMGDVLDFITFSEMDRYKTNAGTQSWKEKGDLKVWGKLRRIVGRTGYSEDPETGLKNMMKAQSRMGQ